MKKILFLVCLFLSALAHSDTSYAGKFQAIEGPLLGQKPPGSTPEVFAPDIVNTEAVKEIEGLFAGDMNTFYFPRGDEDGKYLLFDRRVKSANNQDVNIYWVDAQISDRLKAKP